MDNVMAVRIMGVCNVTPDSFSGDGWMSEGNSYQQLARGNELQMQLLNMIEQGADIVDVGGESTAPGSQPITQEVEMRRLRFVLESVKGLLETRPSVEAKFSIDTVNSATAQEAIQHGFTYINDVSGGRHDEKMFDLLAANPSVNYVMMYCKNASGRADDADNQTEVQAKIYSFFDKQVDAALAKGVQRTQLILDPGMGSFISMDPKDSVNAIRAVPEMKKRYQVPVLIGASRKGFLASMSRRDYGAKSRIGASIAAALFAAEHGAEFLRVHDILATRQFLDVHHNLRQ